MSVPICGLIPTHFSSIAAAARASSGNATEPVPVPPAVRAALEVQSAEERAATVGRSRRVLTTAAPQQIWFRGRANLRAMWVYLEQSLNSASREEKRAGAASRLLTGLPPTLAVSQATDM